MTSKPPAEIQTLIDTHITGFNTQNRDLFLSVFGDNAIIIDGIAPYRWFSPGAPACWLAAVEKLRKANRVVEDLSYEMGFWNMEGLNWTPDLGPGLVGKSAVSLLDGADHDEENETED